MTSKIKGLIMVVLLCGTIESSFAQKKVLDFTVQDTWPILKTQQISNDGKFVIYTVSTIKDGINLTVQSTKGTWKREISNLENGDFTQDSKRFIFTRSDSIGILDLQKDSLTYIIAATNSIIPKNGNGRWFAYKSKKPLNELVLRDFFSGKDRRYPGVSDFLISDDGEKMVMQVGNGNAEEQSTQVVWVDLSSGKRIVIAENCHTSNMTFDHTGRQFIFLAKEILDNKPFLSLRYFKSGMRTSAVLANPASAGMDGMTITGAPFFSPKDSRVFFRVQGISNNTTTSGFKSGVMHIRNYQEDENYQNGIIDNSKPRLATIALKGSPKLSLLEKTGDSYNTSAEDCSDDFIIKKKSDIGNKGRDSSKVSLEYYSVIYLVSCRDGARKPITKNVFGNQNLRFSPDQKYLYWFDSTQKNWLTYSVRSGKIKNVSEKTQVPMIKEKDYPNEGRNITAGLIGWLGKDERMIIYDQFSDIWLLDPDGSKLPVNLSHSYCKNHHIQLQYLDFKNDWNHSIPFRNNDTLLFSGQDIVTKANGFFKMVLTTEHDPLNLIMEPRMLYHNPTHALSSGDVAAVSNPPLKAKNTGVYIVVRMSATEYPNLFSTDNFRIFSPLTNLEPQKEYNWFTSELQSWKLPDGKETQGVLYKPENFDPNEKYPVIFFYYEKDSGSLNCFMNPALSNGAINIPWYVSNGYLVFVPDIYYHIGHPGKSAYDALVSAAEYMTKMSFVDSNHMGLQGHSFGGFETNYIVTHSHLFAAAAPAAGMCDIVDGYNSSKSRGQDYYEDGQGRIGATLWQRPDLYIENSPIFRANQVETPLLVLHNLNDAAVPFNQGMEWYNGLVRAGKRVWMLSYEGEGHTINDEKNKLDYTIRQTQFFDHFLKGKPAPDWMTAKPDYSILNTK